MEYPANNHNSRAPLLLKLITPVFSAKTKEKLQINFRPVFILSTGRTATTYLADVLNHIDGVTALHEPKPSYLLRLWSVAAQKERVSDDYLYKVFLKQRRKLVNKINTPIYIESNPFIIGFVNVLAKVFPGTVVIHIVRDPRNFITSSVNNGKTTGLKWLFIKYVPYWVYTPPGQRDVRLDPAKHSMIHWEKVNQILSDYGTGNDNYHLFKFEEIFDKSQPKISELLKVIGVEGGSLPSLKSAKMDRNESTDKVLDKWQEWPSKFCKEVDEVCGQLMQRYGYGQEELWKERAKSEKG